MKQGHLHLTTVDANKIYLSLQEDLQWVKSIEANLFAKALMESHI